MDRLGDFLTSLIPRVPAVETSNRFVPNDLLLTLPRCWGLTEYLHSMLFLVFFTLSISHLVLPLLASLNSDSYIFKKHPRSSGADFLHDWSYHLINAVIIPLSILLIYRFHWNANDFIREVLASYESSLHLIRRELYLPVISVIITSGIAFLLYKFNRKSYGDANKTTWWWPKPKDKPALSTVFFHIWFAAVGSTLLVCVIHHLIISTCVYGLLSTWNRAVILQMDKTDLISKFYLMGQYFRSPIYVVLPGVVIGCIIIVARRQRLGAKFADPVVIISVVLMTVGLFLLYFIPLLATGLASKIAFAKVLVADERITRLTIFPSIVVWSILSPVWSIIGTTVIGRAIEMGRSHTRT